MPSVVTFFTCVAGAFAPARMFVNLVGLSLSTAVVCRSDLGVVRSAFLISEVWIDLQNMVVGSQPGFSYTRQNRQSHLVCQVWTRFIYTICFEIQLQNSRQLEPFPRLHHTKQIQYTIFANGIACRTCCSSSYMYICAGNLKLILSKPSPFLPSLSCIRKLLQPSSLLRGWRL